MKQLIVLGLFALISIKTYSQATLYVGENFMNNYRNVKINTSKNSYGENITGTPFTTDDFVWGKVIGYKYDYLLKYDAFSDQMLAKRKDDKIVIVNKETITEVTFNDGTKYVVFDYTFDGAKKNGYLEVLLSNSEISLLKKEVSHLNKSEELNCFWDPFLSNFLNFLLKEYADLNGCCIFWCLICIPDT